MPNSNELSVELTFGFSDGKRNLRKLLSVSEKFLFYTDVMVSIEWLHLVPRLRFGGCFEIHILH